MDKIAYAYKVDKKVPYSYQPESNKSGSLPLRKLDADLGYTDSNSQSQNSQDDSTFAKPHFSSSAGASTVSCLLAFNMTDHCQDLSTSG